MHRGIQDVLAKNSLRSLVSGLAAGACKTDSKPVPYAADTFRRWLATTSDKAADPFGMMRMGCVIPMADVPRTGHPPPTLPYRSLSRDRSPAVAANPAGGGDGFGRGQPARRRRRRRMVSPPARRCGHQSAQARRPPCGASDQRHALALDWRVHGRVTTATQKTYEEILFIATKSCTD
jgi:hypothetical protein